MKREDSTTKWIDAEDATRGCKYVVEVTGEGLDVAYFDHAGDWCIDGGDVSERISTRALMIPPDDELTLGRIFDHGDDDPVDEIEDDDRVVLDLSLLSPAALVGVSLWAGTDGREVVEAQSRTEIVAAVCREAERRGWPDGWWEDPSVIPEIAAWDASSSRWPAGSWPRIQEEEDARLGDDAAI